LNATARGRYGAASVRGLACAISVASLALAAAPASADTITLTAGPDPARDSAPVTVHVGGDTTAPQPYVAVYQQQAAGQSCPDDPSAVADPATFPLIVATAVASGTFQTDYRTSFAAGTTRLCGYLTNGGGPPFARAAHDLLVRPVRVLLALGLPRRVEVGERYTGDVSYPGLPDAADASLWADVKLDDGRGCAPTRAQEPPAAQVLLAPGGAAHTFSGRFSAYGRYLVCVWMVRHDGSTLAGPVSATITAAHITGGRPFRGMTSQGLAIRFRRLGHTIYGTNVRVRLRCADGSTSVRTIAPGAIVLTRGRFAATFTGGSIRGLIGRSAHGTLRLTPPGGARCTSGRVAWHAAP
jgi:hypothetical protein